MLSLCEILRRRDDHAPGLADLARDEARVFEDTNANGHVDAVLDEVHDSIGQQELTTNRGVASEERRHHRSGK